jgi:hypothetical protein
MENVFEEGEGRKLRKGSLKIHLEANHIYNSTYLYLIYNCGGG